MLRSFVDTVKEGLNRWVYIIRKEHGGVVATPIRDMTGLNDL